jgi:HAD superfamily hydrolase (TIGR01549 family)
MNAIHRLVGMGADQLVRRLLGQGSPRAVQARPSRYRQLLGDARVFPATSALLRCLHNGGLVVVVATSAPRDELDAIIELLDADDAIDAVTSSDDVDTSKPDPDVFESALRRGPIDRDRTLVVGDSVWDVHAARAAGLPAIAVETGGFCHHELSESGAVDVYRDVQEILDQAATRLAVASSAAFPAGRRTNRPGMEPNGLRLTGASETPNSRTKGNLTLI